MTPNDLEFIRSALSTKGTVLLREIAENDALRKRVEEETKKKLEEQKETKKEEDKKGE